MSESLVDRAVLKTFAIPSSLNTENFDELANKAFVEIIAVGKNIFRQGDTDKKIIYLLEGDITMVANNGQSFAVVANTQAAFHPLDNFQPRKCTAVAKTDCKITRIDSDLFDMLTTWDQMSAIEVGDIAADDDGDWMSKILQSKFFLQVPPANIQTMFMKIEEMPVKRGQVIMKQGGPGDYYYIIKIGQCKVSRKSKAGSELTLAKLKDGDAFGEEALLSDDKRNANVVMLTDGLLMRLSKKDFTELLKEPMLTLVSKAEGDEMVKKGAMWLDVRLESEHKNNGFEGSINIPLFMLRIKAAKLPENKKYIIYCDTGSRSSAAAFLLSGRGLNVMCLKGGLTNSA